MPGRSGFPGNGPQYVLYRGLSGPPGRLEGSGEEGVHWPHRGSWTTQLLTYRSALRNQYNLTVIFVWVVLSEYVTVLQ